MQGFTVALRQERLVRKESRLYTKAVLFLVGQSSFNLTGFSYVGVRIMLRVGVIELDFVLYYSDFGLMGFRSDWRKSFQLFFTSMSIRNY